jgi:predicted neutral ceramidase superfamily lipid hydrolase
MKRNKSNSKFWPVLTTVNIVTLVYPINLLLRANSVDENLFAAFALIGLVFLLMVVDAVSILVAEEVGITRR